MAISIKTQPGTRYSVHGDLIFVVDEPTKTADPVTYADYRFIADVYVNTTLVTRLKSYPDPTNKFGIFNISNVLRNYITPVFNPTASQFIAQTLGVGDWNVSGTVKFGEEYGFTLYPNLLSDGGRKYFGHYNGRMLGVNTNLLNVANYLSERPRITSIYRNTNNSFIPYYNYSLSTNVTGVVTLYDSSNNVISTKTATVIIPQLESIGIINIGIAGINQFMSGTGSVTDATAYYTVQLQSLSETAQTIRVNLLCETKHDVFTLHFLNRWGGFDSRDFTKLSRKLIDVEKKDFGKLPYTVNASGIVSYYNSNNVYNEQRSVYSSQYREKMTLNTDVLTDDEYTWLGDLILSPMVYIEQSGYFLPIVISATNYEFRKTINDKVTALTVSIEFGDNFNAQYR